MEQLLNILAVDDEPGVTTALTLALESPRRRLSSACDGEDALAKMTQPTSYDVVITDNNMPRLSGLGLVRRLRENGFAGRIVVLSAHLTEQNRRAYLELNVDRLLEKPFDLQSLRRAIDGLEKAA